jgi:hypothetical protein
VKIDLCETEKELESLVLACCRAKVCGKPIADKSLRDLFIERDEVTTPRRVEHMFCEFFRRVHKAKHNLFALYPEFVRLSAEYDYLQTNAVWYFARKNMNR